MALCRHLGPAGFANHHVGAMQSINAWAGRSAHELGPVTSPLEAPGLENAAKGARLGLKIEFRSLMGEATSLSATRISVRWLSGVGLRLRDMAGRAMWFEATFAHRSDGAGAGENGRAALRAIGRTVVFPLASVGLTTAVVLAILYYSALKFTPSV